MITVLSTFYHPDFGAIRGIVIDGSPMFSCKEVAYHLGCHDGTEAARVMRKLHYTKDVIVPVNVDAFNVANVESLLFINAAAVLRLVECSTYHERKKYAAWIMDFVFPVLLQMDTGSRLSEDAHSFYWTCDDPILPMESNYTAAELFE